jgi:hypothetical protein
MLALVSTSDVLRIVTDLACDLDVHASWSNLASGTVTSGRTNTLITTATTTTVVGSPAASAYRNVRRLSIRNGHASGAVLVRVQHFDGSTAVDLIGVSLRAGHSLEYEEDSGWSVVSAPYGVLAAINDWVFLVPTAGALYTTVLPVDVANSNATANRMRDVDALAFPVNEGSRYWFRYSLSYTSAATGTGSRWSIYGPGSPTALRYKSVYSLTASTITTNHGVSAYDTPTASNATSAATGSNHAIIEGFVDNPTCDGRVLLRFASEASSSAVTLKAGSSLWWMRVT